MAILHLNLFCANYRFVLGLKAACLLIEMQPCSPGETLVAPNVFFAEDNPQILFSGKRYFLKLQGGDLALFSNFGKGLKQYWSLKKTLTKNVDLSQVAYASKSPFKSCFMTAQHSNLKISRFTCLCIHIVQVWQVMLH